MNNGTHSFTAYRVTQPIGDFYVTKLPIEVITQCSKAEERIEIDESEKMLGIQRSEVPRRVKEISKYVQTVDASFPNSVILNINEKNIIQRDVVLVKELKLDIFTFEIKICANTFQIIDGQHRLAGLKQALIENYNSKFDVVVAFFINLPDYDQAYLFSTINSKQSKVNKSRLMELFDISNVHTPEKCAHIITKSLNSDSKSPLYQRISLLGRAPRFENDVLYKTVLTQGTVASRITRLLSSDTIADRDTLKQGKKLEYSEKDFEEGRIFRKFYVEEKDWVILKILSNYFCSITKTFPDEWSDERNPLSKTIGYGALISFLVVLFKIGYKEGKLSEEFFMEHMKTVRQSYEKDSNKLEFGTFQASGAGESMLFKKLVEWAMIKSTKD